MERDLVVAILGASTTLLGLATAALAVVLATLGRGIGLTRGYRIGLLTVVWMACIVLGGCAFVALRAEDWLIYGQQSDFDQATVGFQLMISALFAIVVTFVVLLSTSVLSPTAGSAESKS